MKKIITSQLSMWIYFASIFILNEINTRFDIGINVHIITVLLIIIGVLSITLVPPIRSLNLYYLILIDSILFIILRILPNLSYEIKPYVQFFIEYIFLLISIGLVVWNNHTVEEINLKLDIFNIPKLKHQILDLFETSDMIEQEFNRARRYNYPISIVIIKLGSEIHDSKKRMEDPQKSFNRKLAYKQITYQLIKHLDEFVREFDQIIKIDDQRQVLILCPETSEENAAKLVNRFSEKIFSVMNISPEVDIVSFPKDGPTFRSILSFSERKGV